MPCFVDIEGAGKQEDMMQLALHKKVLVVCEDCFAFAQTKENAETRGTKNSQYPGQPAGKMSMARADPTLISLTHWSLC